MTDDLNELLDEPSPFRIDKGIPLPDTGTMSSLGAVFRRMAVGDSFYAEKVSRSRLASLGTYLKDRDNKQFTIRKCDGGFRIWRIK